MMLPKYFKNLTLAISSITGIPRICSSDGKLYYVTGGSFRDRSELLLHIEIIKSELVKQLEAWEGEEYERK